MNAGRVLCDFKKPYKLLSSYFSMAHLFQQHPYRFKAKGYLSCVASNILQAGHTNTMRPKLSYLVGSIVLYLALGGPVWGEEPNHIQPYEENPYYWQYKGKPVMLLGGSKDDNLFQLLGLKEHLEEIADTGGNYIRNTMSKQQDKQHEEYPFKQLENGKYDLNQWNDDYWRRFENMLRWTCERDIIVQIEVWDRFYYSRDNWPPQPYNPKNNINYTYEELGFQPEYPKHPGANVQPFFFTTPKQQNNQTVLQYQQRCVNKLLDHTLNYPNVLYCIDNETSGEEAWAVYWATFIHRRAQEENKLVYLTEMWDEWDLRNEEHRRSLDHPGRFDFVDVSQNNHQRNETHWHNFLWVRSYISDQPRPINNVKIYGAHGSRYGNERDAVERMWRLIFAGAASARFHRPILGIGLSKLAKAQLRSARMFLDEFSIFQAHPDAEHKLLSNRGEDEAYLTQSGDKQYAVYFTDGGKVTLRVPAIKAPWQVKWLHVGRCQWQPDRKLPAKNHIDLKAPGNGPWVVLVKPAN